MLFRLSPLRGFEWQGTQNTLVVNRLLDFSPWQYWVDTTHSNTRQSALHCNSRLTGSHWHQQTCLHWLIQVFIQTQRNAKKICPHLINKYRECSSFFWLMDAGSARENRTLHGSNHCNFSTYWFITKEMPRKLAHISSITENIAVSFGLLMQKKTKHSKEAITATCHNLGVQQAEPDRSTNLSRRRRGVKSAPLPRLVLRHALS